MSFEDFRPKPYDDGGGVITIGYGHTRSAVMPASVTEEEALALLKQDVEYFENVVNNEVRVPVNENQYAALVSLVFNVGEGSFRNSRLLKKLNNANYDAALAEFSRGWDTINGKPAKGLVRRRAAEHQLFKTPPPTGVQVTPLDTKQAWVAMTIFDDEGNPQGMDPQFAEGMAVIILPTMNIGQPDGGEDGETETGEANDNGPGEVADPGSA
jgi:lysozyme